MTAETPRRDIADREDIAGLVTAFYRRAFADDVLGTIFLDIAQMDLPAHLPVMCDFWETVLLRAGVYHRNALRPHLDLNTKVELTPAHFARWLDLWTATVDERYTGEKAELAKVQGHADRGLDRLATAGTASYGARHHPAPTIGSEVAMTTTVPRPRETQPPGPMTAADVALLGGLENS